MAGLTHERKCRVCWEFKLISNLSIYFPLFICSGEVGKVAFLGVGETESRVVVDSIGFKSVCQTAMGHVINPISPAYLKGNGDLFSGNS